MLKVLQVVPDMGSGGIENYIMNMYRNVDRGGIQFDFLVHHARKAFFDDEIERMGGRIHRLPVLDNKNVFAYKRRLAKLFAENDYPIVHGHAASLASFYLSAAKNARVPIRIAHSHGTSFLKTPKGYAKRLLFKGAKRYANVRLACSTEAGEYLFGSESFELAKNAIPSKRFAFNVESREHMRAELGVSESCLVVGHVGRFNLQKNHDFLIDIFKEVNRCEPNSALILLGTGELQKVIQDKVRALSLENHVFFRDVVREPEAYYAAMDSFVLPSLFEGLPLVGIEAQCNGLPCLFSSSVTREVAITDLAKFVPLDSGASVWAKEIVKSRRRGKPERDYSALVEEAGYDCVANARAMSAFYSALAERGSSFS